MEINVSGKKNVVVKRKHGDNFLFFFPERLRVPLRSFVLLYI